MNFLVDPSLFFDPNGNFSLKESYLPLLDQQGKLQFITFRCFDSIPAKIREEIKDFKEYFIKTYPLPWDIATMVEFRKTVGKREESLLDNGYGKCLLKSPEYRKIVDDALEFFNKDLYDLHAYVIMPNHVHILMAMLGDNDITECLESIKKFTATKINKITGEKGKYWDGQNYCRLIRNQDHYDIVRSYINKNPRNLRRGEFSLRNYK